jgi:Ca-activated chloride channel homolog
MTAMAKQSGGRRIGIALTLPLLLWSSRAGAQQEPFNISVDVNLVVLHATVHDRRGHDVLNLRQQDFKLYEDGVEQTIRLFRREDAPVTVGLVVDHSGSMASKLGEVSAAARTFAQFSNPMDEMFVLNFNEKIVSGLAGANRFSDMPAELEDAIARAPADGRTALYDAIAAGLEQLDRGTWDKKILVVISDGGDNASTHTLTGITTMAGKSSAVIYAIGMFTEADPDANPGVLKRLTQGTGGEAFFPKQLSETTDICAHIADDIRNQYMIGYVSSNAKPDGSYRGVRLAAGLPGRDSKLRVRTRTGYIGQRSSK